MFFKKNTSFFFENDSEMNPIADLNITPLTDVFLVLLIIFMVTSSILSKMGLEVKLPQTTTHLSQGRPEGVLVTLFPNGDLKVAGARVVKKDGKRFQKLLKKAFQKTKRKLVILEGDQRAFLGNAVWVMDEAKRVGAESFAIATVPKNGNLR